MIKKIKLSLLGLFIAVGVHAQDLPKPSPYGEVMQRVGLTDITVMYSRPGVKDRTIFGGLLSYGEVWRTGANASTKIKLTTDATIGEKMVEAGTYSIFTIPTENEWKVVLNSDVNASEGSYKAENNVAEISVNVSDNEMVETLTFTFANVKEDMADLVFEWASTTWSIPIKVEVTEMAMENIKGKMNELERAYGAYNSSARYYYDHDQDIDQALKWSKKSVEISAQFWNLYTLSLIQHKKGDVKAAIATAKKSKAMAEEAENKAYVERNEKNIADWSK